MARFTKATGEVTGQCGVGQGGVPGSWTPTDGFAFPCWRAERALLARPAASAKGLYLKSEGHRAQGVSFLGG